MNEPRLREEIIPKAVSEGAREAVSGLGERGMVALGGKIAANGSARLTAKYAPELVRVLARSSTAPSTVHVGQAVWNATAGVRAAQEFATAAAPVVGKVAGGALAGPLSEVLALKCDGKKHTKGEYAGAAGRGAFSGALGGAANAGVAFVLGPAAGVAAGIVVSIYVGRKLRQRKTSR